MEQRIPKLSPGAKKIWEVFDSVGKTLGNGRLTEAEARAVISGEMLHRLDSLPTRDRRAIMELFYLCIQGLIARE